MKFKESKETNKTSILHRSVTTQFQLKHIQNVLYTHIVSYVQRQRELRGDNFHDVFLSGEYGNVQAASSSIILAHGQELCIFGFLVEHFPHYGVTAQANSSV